jgi:hypothetical protein
LAIGIREAWFFAKRGKIRFLQLAPGKRLLSLSLFFFFFGQRESLKRAFEVESNRTQKHLLEARKLASLSVSGLASFPPLVIS